MSTEDLKLCSHGVVRVALPDGKLQHDTIFVVSSVPYRFVINHLRTTAKVEAAVECPSRKLEDA
jgi:hypothetical protein